MAMKDALGGWSGGGPMHAQCLTVDTYARGRATVPAHQRHSRRGHIRTTLTIGPAGLPHPSTWASLLDTGAWTIARNCPVTQVRYTLYTNRRPFLANPLSQDVPPTWISTTTPGRRGRRLFFVNISRAYSVNTVNRLTGLFPHS